MNSFITCPAIDAVNSPKSTSASAAGGWLCGTITCRRSAPISTFSRATRLRTLDSPTRAPSSSTNRCQIRRAVCRCFRGAARSAINQPRTVAIPAQHRRRPRRRLTRRRDRINQRLPDRATMHPVPVRERPDRQTLITTITSDTFELLHSRSLLQTPPPLLNALADDTKAPGLLGRGWGHFKPALRLQLGPLQAGTLTVRSVNDGRVRLPQQVLGRTRQNLGAGQSVQDHEAQGGAASFLVHRHGGEQVVECVPPVRDGQADRREDRSMAGGGRVVQPAGKTRKFGGEDHADADGFAVAHPVALAPLDRVAKRVAVVEQLTADPAAG